MNQYIQYSVKLTIKYIINLSQNIPFTFPFYLYSLKVVWRTNHPQMSVWATVWVSNFQQEIIYLHPSKPSNPTISRQKIPRPRFSDCWYPSRHFLWVCRNRVWMITGSGVAREVKWCFLSEWLFFCCWMNDTYNI